MGLTLILDNHDNFNLQLAAYLCRRIPQLKVYSSAHSGRSQDSLRSLSRFGWGIEVGSVAQGILDAALFQNTEHLVGQVLNYLEEHNRGELKLCVGQLDFYEYVESVDYPRDSSGNIQAMIHPQLQSKDYEALHPGDPIFLTFDYETIFYQGDSATYPVFINEAAYYKKNIAFLLTEKRRIQLGTDAACH
jgi:succinylglutamate desuccinylase